MWSAWRSSRAEAFCILTGAFFVAGVFTGAGAQEGEKKKKEVGKWNPSLESGLTITQSAYSDNWGGGDEGSLVWALITNASLENQLSEKANWSNVLKLAFGQTHRQNRGGDRNWERPEKSTDLIDFETIFRFTFGWHVDPYLSGRFESQFQDVSDTTTTRSILFNPLKFKESGGVARQFIDEEDRSLLSRLGFTFRQSSRRFFVDPSVNDETTTESSNDGGLEWVTDYKTKILEDQVSWTSKLTFYQPVFYSEKDVFEDFSAEELSGAGLPPDIVDYTTTMDIDWENIFTTQITKYLSVNLYTRWMYDKYDNTVPPVLDDDGALDNADDVRAAVRKGGQFKETISIGITYRFL